MQREWLANDCLRIWLTKKEAQALGLGLEEASAAPAQKRSQKLLLSRILSDATEERPRLSDCSWTVEALPLAGGFMLLCTPRQPRALLRKPRGPFVLRLENTDALFALVRGFQRTALPPPRDSALFAVHGSYRLILYPAESGDLPPFFREYADDIREGETLAAAVAEHGKLLLPCDALPTLAAVF